MLRPPDFGNRFRLISNTRIHRTLDQNLRTLQGNQVKWEEFYASYSALDRQQVNDFADWVTKSFGTQVTFTDFEARVWTGIITSKSIPILCAQGECRYQVEFEFSGTISSPITP